MKDVIESPYDCSCACKTAAGSMPEIRDGFYARFGKRLLDIALALAMAPAVAIMVAGLWLVVRRDGGPGLFAHARIGRGGTPFRCWKIRTMVPDAELRLTAVLASDPLAAAEWARDRKLTRDPRVTPVGAVLRRCSLDELPQVWNVLRGEMSFVGPRPVMRDEVAKYGAAAPYYLALRPGITGLWQVSGRNDLSYAERVELDVAYGARQSALLDLRLILRTGLAVVGRTGK